MQFQLISDCIIESTPINNLDLSQSRRKRKKQINLIDNEWLDSYSCTNEEDEDDDDDNSDDEEGEIDNDDDDDDNNNNNDMI